MKTTSTTPARVYVGTYAKYNSGSIGGGWMDLDDYPNKESFLEAARDMHKDESDPELMFQDFEGIPRGLYSESSVSDAIWQWLEWDDHHRQLVAMWLDHHEGGQWPDDIEDAIVDSQDAYAGEAPHGIGDWMQCWAEDGGMLEGVPENICRYIDFDAMARDAQMNGEFFTATDENGMEHVFWNR